MLPEIEIFDLSHLHGARRLVDAGLMNERPHVQFVMGVKNAMPAEEHAARHPPRRDEARSAARRPGRRPASAATRREVMGWALARGADAVRTGLEDNVRVTKDRLARSNAELVGLAVEAMRQGRTPPGDARRGPVAARPAGPGGGASRMTVAALDGYSAGTRTLRDELGMNKVYPDATAALAGLSAATT